MEIRKHTTVTLVMSDGTQLELEQKTGSTQIWFTRYYSDLSIEGRFSVDADTLGGIISVLEEWR